MPRWGRPPGARLGRQSRWWAAQWADDDGRIEEIDSDDDVYEEEHDDPSFYPRRLTDAGDGRRWRSRAPEYDRYEDGESVVDGTDYDLYGDGDSTVAYAVQLAMKDKEDWLVEKALERIRRAQMLGQENVRLSKRELEALERKRMQTDDPNPPQRKKGAPKADKRRQPERRPKSSGATAPPYPVFNEKHGSGGRATGAAVRPVHPGARPTSSSGRPRTPTPTHALRAQQSRPPFQQPYPSDRYLPGLENRQPSSSRNETFQRPLPDDPRWVPPYRGVPHYAPYSMEHSPYQAFTPYDPRQSPYNFGYRSFSDGRHSSSTSNSLSPRMPPSGSATDESSEEEEESDSDEEEVVERKVAPAKQAAVSRRGRGGGGGGGRQRAKRG